MSTKGNKKAESERKVFSLFAQALKWPADQELIESRPVPEPDILYSGLKDKIAFELVEICDPAIAHQIGKLKKLAKSSDGVAVSNLWTEDPTESTLINKLQKTYKTTFPIELLCFWDANVISAESQIISEIQHQTQQFGSNQFRCIWYFGEKKVVRFSFDGELLNITPF